MDRKVFYDRIRGDKSLKAITDSESAVKGTETILDALDALDVTNVAHQAYILATAFHETAHTMRPVREAYWLSESWRRENLRYYPWYGRGYVQLTWEANYKKAGEKLGVDMTTNPDVALDPTIAAKVLIIGMREGWFTGKSLSDYITSTVVNFREARRIVNWTDKAQLIAGYAQSFRSALEAAGADTKEPAPTPASPAVPIGGIVKAVAALLVALAAAFGGDAIDLIQKIQEAL